MLIPSSRELTLLNALPHSATKSNCFFSGIDFKASFNEFTSLTLSLIPAFSNSSLNFLLPIDFMTASSFLASLAILSMPKSLMFKLPASSAQPANASFNCCASSALNLIPAISTPLLISIVPSNMPCNWFAKSSLSLPWFSICISQVINSSCSTSVTLLSAVTASIIVCICWGKSSFWLINQSTSTSPVILTWVLNSEPKSLSELNCFSNAIAMLSPFLISVAVLLYALKKLFKPLDKASNLASASPEPVKLCNTVLISIPVKSDIVCAIWVKYWLYCSADIAPSSYWALTSAK